MMKNKQRCYSTPIFDNKAPIVSGNENTLTIEAKYQEAMTELKKIYWHEKQLLIAIPMLLQCATTFELVESLTMLAEHTREHIKKLETQFPEITEMPKSQKHLRIV